MRIDSFVAALFLLAASVVSFSAYRAIQRVERPRDALLQSIPTGAHNYSVFSGGQCLGTFDVSFNRGEQTILTANGQFQFSFEGRSIPVKSFLGAYFNVLEQLVACNVNLEGDNFRIDVKMLNPNPMRIDVALTVFGRTVARSLTIPGPVMLSKNDDGTFRVEYALANKLNATSIPGALRFSNDDAKAMALDFQVSPIETTPAACDFAAGIEPMKIDSLAERVRTAIPLLRNFGAL